MLDTIQNHIKDLLLADPWFQDEAVEILTEEKGDIIYDLEKLLATLNKVAVLIVTPAGQPKDPASLLVDQQLAFAVGVTENYKLNQSGKRARQSIIPVQRALSGKWSGIGSSNIAPQSGNRLKCMGWALDPESPKGKPLYEFRYVTDIKLQLSQLPTSGD